MSHLKKIALGFTCLAGTFNLVSADTKMNQLKPFFTKYCIDCHNAEEQEGDVRLDDMSKFDAELWTDIYDVIDMGDMPPEDESQPTEAHTIAALKLIDEIARDDSVTIASGFRRMNRREYRNTVLDLLGLNKDHFDPAAFVFEDQIEKGFDTNSDSLSISNELLLEYHRAATFSLRAALFTDNPKKPEQLKHTYKGKQIKTNSYIGGSGPNGATSKVRDALIFAPDAASKITASGRYRITFTAAGADHIEQRKDLDYKVGLGFTHNGVNTPTEIFTVVDKTIKFTTHSAELWLEEGAMPYINFASGHPKPRNINRGRARKNLPPIPSPGLTVSNITIEGPIDVE